jgi:hypothetical protein
MSDEDSQFELPVIQLRESKTQPKVSFSREIGEAQITHTIFGRAKVRIIRKGDQARRYMVLAALAVVAVTAAAWQGLFTSQPTEPLQSAVQFTPANSEVQAGTPASQPEYIATSPVIQIEPATPATVNTPSISQKNVPQQPPAITVAEQKTVKSAMIRPKSLVAQPDAFTVQQKPVTTQPKPVTAQPLAASKPQTVPSKQPVAQPAASSPAAVAPLTAPPVKDDSTTQSPIGDKLLSDPVNVQSK